MVYIARPTDPERVTCEVCGRIVPRASAAIVETREHVVYFCGPACCQRWTSAGRAPQPEPPVQLGRTRSKLRDARARRERGVQ